MGWVFLAVAVIAVAFVFWDMFIRGKKGPALAWSVAAMITVSAGGIAQGAEGGPWALIGVIAGGVLWAISERADTTRRSKPRSR